jgi:steroid 5-alpha reductase family enzyme
MLWIGVFVSASNGYDRPGQWLSLLSPMFVAFLLTKVSGIPLLEAAATKKWGDDGAYQRYKAQVPVLIPFIGRTGDAAF